MSEVKGTQAVPPCNEPALPGLNALPPYNAELSPEDRRALEAALPALQRLAAGVMQASVTDVQAAAMAKRFKRPESMEFAARVADFVRLCESAAIVRVAA